MQFIPIKTKIFQPPQDDLYKVLDKELPSLQEGDVLLITSKILAIHQGRCIKITDDINKDDLIIQESEKYIPRDKIPHGYVVLALKENTLIPSAGIDESNSDGYYVLWPKNSNEAAMDICFYLKKKFNLEKLAVIITDSHTIPLRYGVMGISIGFYGLNPIKDHRGSRDLFGREIKMSQSNIVDTLSAMGVLLMGECSEQIPLLLIRDADFIEFTNHETYDDLMIPEKDDIYYPLLGVFNEKES